MNKVNNKIKIIIKIIMNQNLKKTNNNANFTHIINVNITNNHIYAIICTIKISNWNLHNNFWTIHNTLYNKKKYKLKSQNNNNLNLKKILINNLKRYNKK